MAKKITGEIRLQLPAGAANPAPPVGPALGAKGVNIAGVDRVGLGDWFATTSGQGL